MTDKEAQEVFAKISHWKTELSHNKDWTVNRAIAQQLVDYALWASNRFVPVDPEIGDAA